MKVLLINPNREQMPWPAIPVGLCTVATSAFRRGHEVAFLDLTFVSSVTKSVQRALAEHTPDVVGVTLRNIDNCNFESPHFYLPEIRDSVVRVVREHAPSAKLVLGGSAVNVAPWHVFRFFEADFAIVGEGEEALPQLLDALASGERTSGIPGVLTSEQRSDKLLPILDTGRFARNEPPAGRALVSDLETATRSEAFRWVDVRKYAARGGPYSIQTKRGCALKCSYCVYNNIEGHRYRLRRASDIADEIAEAIDYGVRQVDFVDSTFNLPLAHARALCEELASRQFPVDFSTMGLNPAAVNDELVLGMKRAGFKSVMCTPESASELTLKTLQKGFQRRQVVRAAEALRKARMPTYWFFMLGAPGETLDTVRETLQFCEEHVSRTDMVLFTTGIRVHPGTPLERTCKDMGWFAEDDDLFEPSWFLSPELDLTGLYDLLVKAAKKHPNWMTNAETVTSPTMTALLQRGLRSVGQRGPFWLHLPKVFGAFTSLGLRQRGLEEHRQRVVAISDIRHHKGS